MSSLPSAVKAFLNGAVVGAAAASLLGLLSALTTLFTGGGLALPGLIDASGGTTNGAASVEFTLGWTVLVAAAVAGGLVQVRRSKRQPPTP